VHTDTPRPFYEFCHRIWNKFHTVDGGSNGLVRGDNVAVVKPVVTAKLVQNILEDDPVSEKK
jgi:hypothetical protein